MSKVPSDDELLAVGDRATGIHEHYERTNQPDQLTYPELYHGLLIDYEPALAGRITVEQVAECDRYASGHSDYRETMALRVTKQLLEARQ